MPKLRSYHFSFGNSSDGPIGFCARVNAHSRADAARILKERLDEFTSDLSMLVQNYQTTGEYIEVYSTTVLGHRCDQRQGHR